MYLSLICKLINILVICFIWGKEINESESDMFKHALFILFKNSHPFSNKKLITVYRNSPPMTISAHKEDQ